MAVQVFQTSDGLLFDTQTAADAHEHVLVNKEAIVKWANEHYPGQGAGTRAANVVLTWEAYRDIVLGK